jgi:hypothetical protein
MNVTTTAEQRLCVLNEPQDGRASRPRGHFSRRDFCAIEAALLHPRDPRTFFSPGVSVAVGFEFHLGTGRKVNGGPAPQGDWVG